MVNQQLMSKGSGVALCCVVLCWYSHALDLPVSLAACNGGANGPSSPFPAVGTRSVPVLGTLPESTHSLICRNTGSS